MLITIAIGNSRRSTQWVNTALTWAEFVDRLREPRRLPVTVEQYDALTPDARSEMKDVGGYVTGRVDEAGARTKDGVLDRAFLAFDADHQPDLMTGLHLDLALPGVAAVLHTTASHRPTQPRQRVLIPVSRPLTSPDEHEALARLVASKIGLHRFDKASFDWNRLMFWPAAASDSEFLFEEVEGAPLDVDAALAEYEDWTDDLAWPRAAGEKAPTTGKDRGSMLDPRGKPGIIGAFCRAYPPARAVEELLGGIFEWEGDSDRRLTWLRGGGNAGGACVTDDGQHIYNSHATDPFGGHAVNTFDLCRVHLHGGDPDDPKSGWDEMVAFARGLDDVAAEIAAARPTAAETFDEFEDDPPPPPGDAGSQVATTGPDREELVRRAGTSIAAAADATGLESLARDRLADLDWSDGERARLVALVQTRFRELTGARVPAATAREWLAPTAAAASTWPDLDPDGAPLMSIPNVERVLSMLGVTVRYNEMKKKEEVLVPGAAYALDNADNASFGNLWSECQRAGLLIGQQNLRTCLTTIAAGNPFNPAVAWVESEPWDGVDRLQALYDTVDSPKRELKEMLMWRWLLQSIAILHNDGQGGLMARGVLTFQGPQYMGKTRWLAALAPAGMVAQGLTLDPRSRDSVKTAISSWLCELGELDATFRRADLSALKAFISQKTDTMRLAYAARESEFPRRTSFFGSVNDAEFLYDRTGNSRFWVVPVDNIQDPSTIDMQQLWAQVLHTWRATGERHWLSPDELALLEESNESFAVTDTIDDLVADKLAWNDPDAKVIWMSTAQIAERIGVTRPSSGDSRKIAAAVRRVSQRSSRGRAGERVLDGRKLFAVAVPGGID